MSTGWRWGTKWLVNGRPKALLAADGSTGEMIAVASAKRGVRGDLIDEDEESLEMMLGRVSTLTGRLCELAAICGSN